MRRSIQILFMSFLVVFFSYFSKAQVKLNPQSEYSPNLKVNVQKPGNVQNLQKSYPWNLQFQFPLTNYLGSAGAETDGTYIYVTNWGGNDIWKFDLQGNAVDTFSIPGVTELRDLAYDGTYFYGGSNASTIYKMNFTTKTLVGTINSPTQTVRSIAYAPDSNAFWIGNWDTDNFELVNTSGVKIAEIPAATHGLTGIYGSAYDTVSAGGPYLWVISANGLDVEISQIHVASGNFTGNKIEVDKVIGSAPPGSGGGLFIQPDMITGTTTIGGVLQNDKCFGYDLSSVAADSFDISVVDILKPIHGYMMSNSEPVEVVVRNNGINAINAFQVAFTVDNGTPAVQNFTASLLPFTVDTFMLTASADLSVVGSHSIKAYTILSTDMVNANDSLTKTVINAENLVLVEILTDDYGDETAWELINSVTNNVVASGGPYLNNVLIQKPLVVSANDCFYFKIYDGYGDGIFAPGYYKVTFNGTVVAANYNFSTSMDSAYFCKPVSDDIGVVELVSPVGIACMLTNSEVVTVKVRNFGTNTVSGFPVSYMLNNGTPVTETYSQNLTAGDTATITFTTNADLSTPGIHEIKAYTHLTSDVTNYNDSLKSDIIHIANLTVPATMGFEQNNDYLGWTIVDLNNDGSSWALIPNDATNANSGTGFLAYNYNQFTSADDWLITKCIELDASITYQVSFYYKAQQSIYEEAMDVFIGTSQDPANLTTKIADLPSITNETYQQHIANFSVPSTGVYYIGFHAKSQADKYVLSLDDIALSYATGIKENIEKSISIFPNPASGFVNISADNEIINSVTVYNTLGQIVLSKEYNEEYIHLNINELESGIYYLKIESNEEYITKKLEVY